MKTIIFVDDDQDLLESVRTRLYKYRHDWTMRFFSDAAQAIAAFESHPIDLIVSDIRMPGMDGGQLFTYLKKRHPSTIRIILSGYADAAQALRLTLLAHQYVAKPCSSGEIENTIERCFRLQELLGRDSLRKVVGRVGTLPAMPKVYSRLQSALANTNVTAGNIADIVTQDAAIASKVLQITNSAFFRRRKPIVRIKDAVIHLGFGTIRNLVMSAELFAHWKMPAILSSDVNPNHLQKHAQFVAQACKSLATGKVLPDDAWLAGLLHDIGYWILVQDCPHELKEAITLSQKEKRPLVDCETQIIGANHAEIGAYLLGLWGLPYPIVEAVAMHHTAGAIVSHEFDLLATLAVAHALVDSGAAGELHSVPVAPVPVDPSYFTAVRAPFDLIEAQRRVKLCVSSSVPALL
jgi:HD-like signal output (HDOD) protein/ActR/RegA family two-component response regulator